MLYRMKDAEKEALVALGGGAIKEYVDSKSQEAKNDAVSTAEKYADDRYGNWKKFAWLNFSAPYGSTWHMWRIGNIVICESDGGTGYGTTPTKWQTCDEVLPTGWRPQSIGKIVGFMPPNNLFAYRIYGGGAIDYMVEGSGSSYDKQGVGVWHTDDPFPTTYNQYFAH